MSGIISEIITNHQLYFINSLKSKNGSTQRVVIQFVVFFICSTRLTKAGKLVAAVPPKNT